MWSWVGVFFDVRDLVSGCSEVRDAKFFRFSFLWDMQGTGWLYEGFLRFMCVGVACV